MITAEKSLARYNTTHNLFVSIVLFDHEYLRIIKISHFGSIMEVHSVNVVFQCERVNSSKRPLKDRMIMFCTHENNIQKDGITFWFYNHTHAAQIVYVEQGDYFILFRKSICFLITLKESILNWAQGCHFHFQFRLLSKGPSKKIK